MNTPAVMVGTACGDALGAWAEQLGDTIHPDTADWNGEFRTGGHLNLPAGHYTDDTDMAICLAQSIINSVDYDGADAAQRYLKWFQGSPIGTGGSTRNAMGRLAAGVSWKESGEVFDNPNKVGSGTAMRAAPLAFVTSNPDELYKVSILDATITHQNIEAYVASFAVASAVNVARGVPRPRQLLEFVINNIRRQVYGHTLVLAMLQTALELYDDRHDRFLALSIGRRGNASQITATAIFCAAAFDNFRDCVVNAVRLGGDADTRAAITGAIAGARFGLENIPDSYKTVQNFDMLVELDRKLVAKAK